MDFFLSLKISRLARHLLSEFYLFGTIKLQQLIPEHSCWVKKGTLVMPSLVAACRQGFPDPDKFDVTRMLPDRAEDRKYRKNYIPFLHGPYTNSTL